MNRLKELRTDRDLKQREVAVVIGTTEATISRYESEEITLTPELIHKFCDYYQVTADYLLGRSAHPHASLSDIDAQILQAFHASPLKIQKVVLDLLELDSSADTKKDATAS